MPCRGRPFHNSSFARHEQEWLHRQVGEERQAAFAKRSAEMGAADALLRRVRLTCATWSRAGFPMAGAGGWFSAADMLARPGVSLQQVVAEPLLQIAHFAQVAGGVLVSTLHLTMRSLWALWTWQRGEDVMSGEPEYVFCMHVEEAWSDETNPDVCLWAQVADAAVMGGAEGADELRALAEDGGMRRSSTASAVYDCRYRPYTAKQVLPAHTLGATAHSPAERLCLLYSHLQVPAIPNENLVTGAGALRFCCMSSCG